MKKCPLRDNDIVLKNYFPIKQCTMCALMASTLRLAQVSMGSLLFGRVEIMFCERFVVVLHLSINLFSIFQSKYNSKFRYQFWKYEYGGLVKWIFSHYSVI